MKKEIKDKFTRLDKKLQALFENTKDIDNMQEIVDIQRTVESIENDLL